MDNSAKDLFDQILAGGLDIIKQIVDEHWFETEILDYKILRKESSCKKILSKALSSFANSRGGIILWGINGSKNEENIDAAQSCEPISNLKVFLSSLNTLTPQVVSPGIQGVIHDFIYEDELEDKGYVLTYIPASEGDPHMATSAGNVYYYRCGDSSQPMPAYMIADRYQRRPQPKLQLVGKLNYSRHMRQNPQLHIYFKILNKGRGIALYPALMIQETNYVSFNVNDKSGLPRRLMYRFASEPGWICYAGGVDHAIHPGTMFDVAIGKIEVGTGVLERNQIHVPYELHCEGYTTRNNATISIEDIEAAMKYGFREISFQEDDNKQ